MQLNWRRKRKFWYLNFYSGLICFKLKRIIFQSIVIWVCLINDMSNRWLNHWKFTSVTFCTSRRLFLSTFLKIKQQIIAGLSDRQENHKQNFLNRNISLLNRHLPIQIIIPFLHSRVQKLKVSDLHPPLTPLILYPKQWDTYMYKQVVPPDQQMHMRWTLGKKRKSQSLFFQNNGKKDKEKTLSSIQETFHRFEQRDRSDSK